jgi:sulfate permease, SulP family
LKNHCLPMPLLQHQIRLFVQELLSAHRLAASLTAGAIAGIVGSTYGISFAALIFSGDLAPHLPLGIGLGLFAAVVLSVVVGTTNSLPGVATAPQEVPATLLSLMAGTIVTRMPEAASTTEVVSTVVVAIAVAALLTGLVSFALGFFKLGNLVRFIPYSVIGGFLAGTGWLLSSAGIGLMTGVTQLSQLPTLQQPDMVIRWLPGVVFALLMLFLLRRYNHSLTVPGMVLGAIALFYITLLLTGTSTAQASVAGLLLGPFPEGSLWQPLSLEVLTQANWSVISHQADQLAIIPIVTILALLLNASGIELVAARDIDLNQELKAAGLANFISGLGGGLIGFHTLGLTTLSYAKIGARSRLVGVFASLFCMAVLVFGASLVAFFPKFVLGGMVLFLGLDFLVEWLWDSWSKLPKLDYLIVLLILVVIAAAGFLQGVGVGVLMAAVLFVINYSQVSVTRHVLSGATHHSHVERPPHQQRSLREQGEQIYILELQGFIFFGTANRLLNQVQQRVAESHHSPLTFVILDFRLVSGIDVSAVFSFLKIKQTADQYKFRLVFTHLEPTVQKLLQQGGCLTPTDTTSQVFPDLDRGLEWCETQILETMSWRRSRFLPLPLQLQRLFSDPEQVANFIPYLEKLELLPEEVLFRQGEQSEALYFLESGQITTVLELTDGKMLRSQTLRMGTVIGEMEFHAKTVYERTAIADQSTTVYRLLRSRLQDMQQEQPETAAVFQEFMLSLLAERLNQAHKHIKNLLF